MLAKKQKVKLIDDFKREDLKQLEIVIEAEKPSLVAVVNGTKVLYDGLESLRAMTQWVRLLKNNPKTEI